MVADNALLSTSDVARLVLEETGKPISPSGVRRWRLLGLLTGERTIGGQFVYRAADVRKLLDRRREQSELRNHHHAA